jgi:hypothetical protein
MKICIMKKILIIPLILVNIFTIFSQTQKSDLALWITKANDGIALQIKQNQRIAYWTYNENFKHIAFIRAITDSTFMTGKDTVKLKELSKIGERPIGFFIKCGVGLEIISLGTELIVEGKTTIDQNQNPVGLGIASGFAVLYGEIMCAAGIVLIPTVAIIILASIPKTFDLNTQYTIKASRILTKKELKQL